MAPLPPPPADQLVTSSDLVRHFGLWQERAARAPLYILHRGRPRFVLTSIETMEALCAPHTASTGASVIPQPAIDPTTLLDAVSDLVLVSDSAGAILATSRAARAHFGGLAALGQPIAAIAPAGARGALHDAIRRVIAMGVGDRLEIPSAARETRTLLLAVEPAGRGVAVIAQDGTTERIHARAEATEQALAAAMHATACVASATITLRGYIADPSPALAALTGRDCAALAQLRFAALVESDAREKIDSAIERAMAGEIAPAIDLALSADPIGAVTVRLGLAPIRSGNAVAGVAAILVTH